MQAFLDFCRKSGAKTCVICRKSGAKPYRICRKSGANLILVRYLLRRIKKQEFNEELSDNQ